MSDALVPVEESGTLYHYRIGDRDVPYRSIPSCLTCQSHHRVTIETEMARGTKLTHIERMLADLDHGDRTVPSYDSLRVHRTKHIPHHVARTATIVKARQDEIGEMLSEDAVSYLDEIAVARLVVDRVGERFLNHDIPEPGWDEFFKAAPLLQKVAGAMGAATIDTAVWTQAFQTFIEITAPFVGDSDAWRNEIESNPIMASLIKRIDAQQKAESEVA